MKVKVQIVIEHEADDTPIVEEVGCLCRGDLLPETLGLTLEEGKQLLARIQETMVTHQMAEYVEQQRPCPHCGKKRSSKGRHEIVYRSLFGKLNIDLFCFFYVYAFCFCCTCINILYINSIISMC